MANNIFSLNSGNSGHRWTFFRAGGFDQVRLDSGADIMSLDQLDQKLWVALSCPTYGLEFDGRTLELLDKDGDGRIRALEILEAIKWIKLILRNPDDLTRCSSTLPLSSINEQSPEGKQLLDSAKKALKNLGREGAAEITIDDIIDMKEMMERIEFNGEGVIPADAAYDAKVRQVIADIIDCWDLMEDRSGKPGISLEKMDEFFTHARAHSDWLARERKTMSQPGFRSAKPQLQPRRHFSPSRTRWMIFSPAAAWRSSIGGPSMPFIVVRRSIWPWRTNSLSLSLEGMSGFPLAQIGIRKALPLKDGINPAWINAMRELYTAVILPLMDEVDAITEAEWKGICEKFVPYNEWVLRKTGDDVAKLGIRRIREILSGDAREAISGLIARDETLETEFKDMLSVEKLVRCHRDLFTLLNNFVSFSDF